jgi:poly(hydroxyalkanoate) depolymerase family esterase
MKFNTTMMSHMGDVTRLLMEQGPAAATASIQQALAGNLPAGPSPRSQPAMKDINPPPFATPWERESVAPAARSGSRFTESVFTNHAGTRSYKLYVPAAYDGTPMPLLVMLHGCTQNPDDFAAGTRMNVLAEEHGFLVAYPAQSRKANQSGCWNWFAANDQKRDHGEPAILAGIVGQVAQDYAVDKKRIFAAGLSAGGAMATTLGTLYPELFAAVGVHSGLPYAAARDLPSALQAMKKGRAGKAPAQLNTPLIVFHGDHDKTVHPRNGSQILADAVASSSTPASRIEERGKSRGGRKYTRTSHLLPNGLPLAEEWVLHGAGHAWSGGCKAGSYTDPTGPDASSEMVRFFRTVSGLV